MNWPTGPVWGASPAKRQAYKTGFMPRRTATDRRHEEARTHTNPLRILVKKCATKSTWKRKTKTTPQLVTLREGEKETRQPQEAAMYTQKLLYKRFGLALRSLPAAKYATQDEQNLKLFCSIWWALKIPIGKEACSRGAIRRGSFTLF